MSKLTTIVRFFGLATVNAMFTAIFISSSIKLLFLLLCPMDYKGIIFDKDGTLFDYFSVWGPVITEFTDKALLDLQRDNKNEIRTQFLSMLGVGTDCMDANGLVFMSNKFFMLSRIFFFCLRHKLSFKKLVSSIKIGYFDSHHLIKDALIKINPGDSIHELFEKFKKGGYKIGIVTSDNTQSTKICLEHLGIEEYVDFISTFDDNLSKKPNPEALNAFCMNFSLKPEEVVVVGDAPVDMKFAKKGKAGYSVAVMTGSNDVKRLSRTADILYQNLQCLAADSRLFPDLQVK
ncbi:MAG: HAD family hydrolase [Bacteroidetes bacterium]|nr:HAD family hydrolase [Bacteroidota bacterium]